MQTRDHPLLENENYLEGYFHGGLGRTPIKSLKPRDGQWMDKPAATPRLRAFVQVLILTLFFSLSQRYNAMSSGNQNKERRAPDSNC